MRIDPIYGQLLDVRSINANVCVSAHEEELISEIEACTLILLISIDSFMRRFERENKKHSQRYTRKVGRLTDDNQRVYESYRAKSNIKLIWPNLCIREHSRIASLSSPHINTFQVSHFPRCNGADEKSRNKRKHAI